MSKQYCRFCLQGKQGFFEAAADLAFCIT